MEAIFTQAQGVQAPAQKFKLTTNFFEDFFDTTPQNVPTLETKQSSCATEEPEFGVTEDLTTGAESEEIKFEPVIRKRDAKNIKKHTHKVTCPGCHINFWKLDVQHGVCHNCVKILESVKQQCQMQKGTFKIQI